MLKNSMANYTNYYIAGVRDGKKTKVFDKNLHKSILSARKIGLKPTSKDAYGFNKDTKKWENLKTSAPVAATFRKDAAKALLQKVKKSPVVKLGDKIIKDTSDLIKKSDFIMPTIKILGEKLKTIKSNAEAVKARKGLLKKFSVDLPSTIMGRTNYNKAIKTIDDYLKKGNYVAASNYMVSQLSKLENQTRGTGSNKYVADKLDNWYGKHLTFRKK